jgi:hypothetical protein
LALACLYEANDAPFVERPTSVSLVGVVMTRTHVAALAALVITFITLITSHAACADAEKFPGTSLADPVLQSDVAQNIDLLESVFDAGCKSARVVNTEVMEKPASINVDPWVERWTVDRCGASVHYRVKLKPSKRGGTDFTVSLMEDSKSDVQQQPAQEEKPAESPSRWQKLVEFHQAVFYVDFSTLTVEGPLRSVWEVRDLKWMSRSGAWSYLNQNQYDCVERRYRGLFFSSQSGHMGEGDVIQSDRSTGEWETDFTDESPAEVIRRAVCEHPVTVTKP